MVRLILNARIKKGDKMISKQNENKNEASVLPNNQGKNIIVSMEIGKDFNAVFLGYNGNEMVVEYSSERTKILLRDIRVTHLGQKQMNMGK
jgi:hypothetical protein